MKNTKNSITFNVIASYLLLAVLAGLAVWFTYSQVLSYANMTEKSLPVNKKLYLVSDAATQLYKAESMSRQLIQEGKPEEIHQYDAEVDSISTILDSLLQKNVNPVLKFEIDSIKILLDQKRENLKELLKLRAQEGDQSYYAKVIAQLKKVDANFEAYDYDQRFKDLEPYQRKVLVQLLEYSKMQQAEKITNQTLDSIMNSIKTVLIDFENADRRYRLNLRNQEKELLTNEASLNSQLRNLLSTIEDQESQFSLEQVATAQKMLRRTSRIIAIFGALSILVIIVFMFFVIRDVSLSQGYRKKLEDAKLFAESLLKSREQFMATVTHDLRSPLNSVVGYANLLERSQLNSSQTNYLNHIQNSSQFILRLVNDLLDLSRLEAGKMSVENLSFNPKNLIEDSVEHAIPAEKPEVVSVEIVVSDDLNQPVVSDPFRIKQILTNLVSNAFKFTKEGKIKVSAYRKMEENQEFMLISVADSGIGISKEKQQIIFDEFSQENTSIEKRFGGSGLGLAISKKLAHLLQGSISLTSEPEKGSEFIVKIPIKPVNSQKTSEKNEIPRKDASHFSILIVDDDPAQINLLREFLKSTGIAFDSSQDGAEALEKLKEKPFDLILTDIQMPGMDGFELLSLIKKDSNLAFIPLLALSGQTDISESEYLEMGFSGSLLKPYSVEKLRATIEKVIPVKFSPQKTGSDSKKIKNKLYSLTEIKAFSGNDPKALQIILKSFIETNRINLSTLKEEFEQENKVGMGKTAHKMLPMFRQLKASEIIGTLEALEIQKADLSPKNFEILSKKISTVLAALEQEIKD